MKDLIRSSVLAIAVQILVAISPVQAATTYVILNSGNNFSDTVEPGATIDQLGHSPNSGSPTQGEGPLLGTGLLFACGTSNVANFSESSAPLGGPTSNFFSCSDRPRNIISGDVRFTVRVTASGRLYDIQFLSWAIDRSPFCVDRDSGASCAAAGGRTSYLRVGPVSLVPQYGCSTFETPLIHDDPLTGLVEQLVLGAKEKRTIPVKLQVLDNGLPLADFTLSVSPVITLMYTSSVAGSPTTTITDLLSPGLADDGNAFRYDPTSMKWVFNLSTRNLSAAGTYTIGVISGDDSVYLLDAGSCAISFVRSR